MMVEKHECVIPATIQGVRGGVLPFEEEEEKDDEASKNALRDLLVEALVAEMAESLKIGVIEQEQVRLGREKSSSAAGGSGHDNLMNTLSCKDNNTQLNATVKSLAQMLVASFHHQGRQSPAAPVTVHVPAQEGAQHVPTTYQDAHHHCRDATNDASKPDPENENVLQNCRVDSSSGGGSATNGGISVLKEFSGSLAGSVSAPSFGADEDVHCSFSSVSLDDIEDDITAEEVVPKGHKPAGEIQQGGGGPPPKEAPIPRPPLSAKKERKSVLCRSVSIGALDPLAPPGHDAKAATTTRSVSFGEVRVRHYERSLSDNPAVRNGPSIGIGWGYVEKGAQPIGEWEYGQRRYRRTADLVLNRAQREKILRDFGYQDKEIARAVRDINRAKAQRRQTVTNLNIQGMEEMVESFTHKVKKVFVLPNNKKQKKDLVYLSRRSAAAAN